LPLHPAKIKESSRGVPCYPVRGLAPVHPLKDETHYRGYPALPPINKPSVFLYVLCGENSQLETKT